MALDNMVLYITGSSRIQ